MIHLANALDVGVRVRRPALPLVSCSCGIRMLVQDADGHERRNPGHSVTRTPVEILPAQEVRPRNYKGDKAKRRLPRGTGARARAAAKRREQFGPHRGTEPRACLDRECESAGEIQPAENFSPGQTRCKPCRARAAYVKRHG